MRFTPCRECPLLKGCEIRVEKRRALKGLNLTAVDFHCDRKLSLFQPGDPVGFEYVNPETGHRGPGVGWVMGWRKSRVRVASLDTLYPTFGLSPRKLTRLNGPRKRICKHCHAPEGVVDDMRSDRSGQEGPWVCRWSRAMYPNFESEPLECEYPQEGR